MIPLYTVSFLEAHNFFPQFYFPFFLLLFLSCLISFNFFICFGFDFLFVITRFLPAPRLYNTIIKVAFGNEKELRISKILVLCYDTPRGLGRILWNCLVIYNRLKIALVASTYKRPRHLPLKLGVWSFAQFQCDRPGDIRVQLLLCISRTPRRLQFLLSELFLLSSYCNIHA